MFDKELLDAFLYFGYVPGCSAAPLDTLCDWAGQTDYKATLARQDVGPLIAEGVAALKTVLGNMIGDAHGDKAHVLPLSGGLDSRAILGGLLENLTSREIQAVTFGTPGTWDYEIGRSTARTVGIRCEAIDLTSDQWHWNAERLCETAARTERAIWLFDAYVNRSIPERFGQGYVYWSGFMGDALSGSHLPVYSSSSWEQAQSYFILRNHATRSTSLIPPHYRAQRALPEQPFYSCDVLSFDDQLDFALRQEYLIRHTVLPKGYHYRVPFLHPKWTNFILGVPRRYREGQYLYREILKTAYPKLFSLPAKNSFGLSLDTSRWRQQLRRSKLHARAAAKRFFPWVDWGVSPSINYIDFDHALREREDLKAVVYESIQDLKKRRIVEWIDIDAIWDRHQRRRGNCADALTLLAALEIALKNGFLRAC